MSVLVGLSLTNHCLDHSEIFFKSVFTMLHKLFISYDFSPMDVSSANNLHKPIVSSAMSLKEKASQLKKCYNSMHCNFLFVNNYKLLNKKHLLTLICPIKNMNIWNFLS